MPDDDARSHPLTGAFTEAIGRRAAGRQPSSVRGAMERFNWTTRDVARRFNVSERTARRWRQRDHIPARRAEQWRNEVRGAAARNVRDRIGRRGLSGMRVSGTYLVDGNPKYRYKARPDRPVYILDGNKISGADMREVFEHLDQGRADEAEHKLSEALSDAYGTAGGATLEWENVDGLEFDI